MQRGKIIAAIALVAVLVAVAFYGKSLTTVSESATRQVTDSTGETIEIPVHPKRVVFLNASNLEMYYAAGGKAVGKPTSSSIEGELAEKTADVPEVGTIHSPNMETILNLQPDLVIGVDVPFHVGIRDSLKTAGIPLYINSLNSLEDVLRTMDFFGELTGEEKIAQEKRKEIEANCAAVTEKAKAQTPPKSLIIFGAPGSFNMSTSKSFAGSLLTHLGGGNIADKAGMDAAFAPLSMEFVAKENPEVIFFISMSKDPAIADSFKAEMAKSTIWKDVNAVKNGRIYYLAGALFTVNPGTRIDEALKILYHDLYEDTGAAK